MKQERRISGGAQVVSMHCVRGRRLERTDNCHGLTFDDRNIYLPGCRGRPPRHDSDPHQPDPFLPGHCSPVADRLLQVLPELQRVRD